MSHLDSTSTDTLARLLARDPADAERVLPIDDRQRALTARYIEPNLRQLEAEFHDIRAVIDGDIQRQIAAGAVPKLSNPYPKGYCLQITIRAAETFEERCRTGRSSVAGAMAEFRAAGGHITKVWGVLREQYFQNALQLGSIYFDVANDTVDTTKPKIEYMPFADSGFRNVTSFADFADVAERYWDCGIYPNLHFPRLAPLLPLLMVTRDRGLFLGTGIHYMQRLNLDSGYDAAARFVTESPWSDRRLSADWIEQIQRYKAEHLPETVQTPPSGVSPKQIARLCTEYAENASYRSRAFLTRVLNAASTIQIQPRTSD